MTPALTISSLNLAIAASSSSDGILPASESLVALTITMKRMGFFSYRFGFGAGFEPRLCQHDERADEESTGPESFLWPPLNKQAAATAQRQRCAAWEAACKIRTRPDDGSS